MRTIAVWLAVAAASARLERVEAGLDDWGSWADTLARSVMHASSSLVSVGVSTEVCANGASGCIDCASTTECAQCGDRTYLHEGRCVMSCPGGTSPVGTGTIGRVCAALQQHRVMRQASSPATTTLQSGTTLPTVLPTATLPEPVTTTTTQPFDIIEMCTVEGRGNCLLDVGTPVCSSNVDIVFWNVCAALCYQGLHDPNMQIAVCAPSVTFSWAPTTAPTAPTAMPTHTPTAAPSRTPTHQPSHMPTSAPVAAPTVAPTPHPCNGGSHGCDVSTTRCAATSIAPGYMCECLAGYVPLSGSNNSCVMSFSPTSVPTDAPTARPTLAHTHHPTHPPTLAPTLTPTAPTASPTSMPTFSPCVTGTHGCNLTSTYCADLAPGLIACLCLPGFIDSPSNTSCVASAAPTGSPTFMPTVLPTHRPTRPPTASPTAAPTTLAPTAPTASPTFAPTLSHCNDGSHGCDPASTYCADLGGGVIECECLAGFVRDTNTSCVASQTPTTAPTVHPTVSPSRAPTTATPTDAPTAVPTVRPTTATPSRAPTDAPTSTPTSVAPTTVAPTAPTASPTAAPTLSHCHDGSHGCDLTSTYCADRGGGVIECECLAGHIRLTDTSCVATTAPTHAPTSVPTTSTPTTIAPTAPTPVPTLLPTFSHCTDGTHGCDLSTTYCAELGYLGEVECMCLAGFVRQTPTTCVASSAPTVTPTTQSPSSRQPTPPPTAAPSLMVPLDQGVANTSGSGGSGGAGTVVVVLVVLVVFGGLVWGVFYWRRHHSAAGVSEFPEMGKPTRAGMRSPLLNDVFPMGSLGADGLSIDGQSLDGEGMARAKKAWGATHGVAETSFIGHDDDDLSSSAKTYYVPPTVTCVIMPPS